MISSHSQRSFERTRIQPASASIGAASSAEWTKSMPPPVARSMPRWTRIWYATMPARASTFHAMPATRVMLGRPVRLDVVAQAAQRREDGRVVLVVGAQLHAVGLRDRERHFEHVDRIEPEAVAVQRRGGAHLRR